MLAPQLPAHRRTGRIIGFRLFGVGDGRIGVMRETADGFSTAYYKGTRGRREQIRRLCRHSDARPNYTEFTP